MKMSKSIYVLLILLSLQYHISARKYSEREVDEELIDIIAEKLKRISTNDASGNKVDPNDHVVIDLWNKLNDDDIKNRSQINDYSDEAAALRWLKWYATISQRYHQVYD